VQNGIRYAFFRRTNSFFQIPLKTHFYVRAQKPDIVIVEGLIFPVQLLALSVWLGKSCRIIVQHHGEKPYSGIRGFFQKMADKKVQAYLFTSNRNAVEWIRSGIIKDASKCREILESSTPFVRRDLKESQQKLGIAGKYNFLWVGRLNRNKDPLTVLRGFEKYCRYQRDARIYMIFQEEDILPEVEDFVFTSPVLKQRVFLMGRVDHEVLPDWYSAMNFYISGSHKEGSGYALLEAMACGCIPVVTAIPSFEKITSNGRYGLLYPPGNDHALATQLESVRYLSIETLRANVEIFFREHLGFRNIAQNLYQVISEL
jgi:glycosyltransferase involved in cell wall biosynthesis